MVFNAKKDAILERRCEIVVALMMRYNP